MLRAGETRRFEGELVALALDCPVLAEPVSGRAGGSSAAQPAAQTEEELVAVAVLSNN